MTRTTRNSPFDRSSQNLTSPERRVLSQILGDGRNTPLSLADALQAASISHDRVRAAAIQTFQNHELEENKRRIEKERQQEEARLKKEAEIAAEQERVNALKRQSIQRPEPVPDPEPPTKEAPKSIQPAVRKSLDLKPSPAPAPQEAAQSQPATAAQPSTTALKQPPTSGSPFASLQKPAEKPSSPLKQVNGVEAASQSRPAPAQVPTQPRPAPVTKPALSISPEKQKLADRYTAIHQSLKQLRKDMVAQSKVPGSPLKGKMGDFRRSIKVSIGQLTAGKGANNIPISKITEILRDALTGKVPSQPIPVATYVVDDRQPAEDISVNDPKQPKPHNDPTMPSLFLYLMNICAKGIISQFAREAGANPKAADPVGVFAAHIFSNKEFQWRGQSLVDILIAKLRVGCPVLFGARGNDKTERGRAALGWKKEDGTWVTEQAHNDRMTGLGAGFAALSLRDFSKTTKVNPYPPSNYWTALALILNTPAGETSNTHYVVLRAMLLGHEGRFIAFYGNAALAAIRKAVLEFPARAPANASAAGSVAALAEVWKSEEFVL
ncbi:Nucleoporin-like protein [Emericellopsis cladophorae]|uniref:mRNA export factor GLE1 n=1 Tax=Emericellopsis cladophorae TaxID=2686198 RepID=A0A9P9Y4K0_9HYPO|nr:Nucleoporin-like protein [Emericellopsis cladophorae]KAI6782993.1 Nucleoporin-like protein [Emericellopsis cladophorae]